jgi:hypothetical protein
MQQAAFDRGPFSHGRYQRCELDGADTEHQGLQRAHYIMLMLPHQAGSRT